MKVTDFKIISFIFALVVSIFLLEMPSLATPTSTTINSIDAFLYVDKANKETIETLLPKSRSLEWETLGSDISNLNFGYSNFFIG
ncbi:hypothetical protein O1D97_01215 [Marinomonas sp. 15G1-11]|uniref:Uncharacterized protein n=1 Tax=Marinomonas phaeophyticola TaxID=3004091 RepID=A0ABT4JQ62_9GAMM|nr:hypothetical protein [Marinomonas sp. 15G1-11]MCZ2720296.1 hypothetical protein [Marinomonas sp. 15G1-11]